MKPEGYASGMSERDLQENVRQLAVSLGIRYYHTYDSRRSPSGFPDVVLASPPSLLVRELKAERGRVTPRQRQWLEDLHGCSCDAGIWRPADWASGRIVRELLALRKGRR